MSKQVTINIFDVEWDERHTQRLRETIDEFESLDLERRWRDDVRLEVIRKSQVLTTDVYALNFVKKRDIGPGRIAAHTPIQSIALRADEDFGEETAALYVPAKKWLLVLHNQNGVGISRMMAYFNALDPGNTERYFNYSACPKIDARTFDKFSQLKNITRVSVTATLDALSAAEASGGTSLAQATRSINARRIHFELSANEPHKKGFFLLREKAESLVQGLLRSDDVSMLKVKGESDSVGEADLMIDLLRDKIKRKFPVERLQVDGHRYTFESRQDLLSYTLRGWLTTL
jgi:hypothetical protein